MKKLIILVSLIALLASGMAFGQITWTGTLEWEVATDFDSGTGAADYEYWEPDHYLHLNAKVDDFNSAYIRLRHNDAKADTGGNRYVYADKAVITTDFLGAFGVKGAPMTWKSELGLNEWVPDNVSNLCWDTTRKILQRPGNKTDYFFDEKISGTRQTMTFADGAFKLAGFFGLANGTNSAADRLQDLFIDAVFALPAGIKAEVAYMKWENTTALPGIVATDPPLGIGDGNLMFGAAYATKINDMALHLGAAYYHPMDTELGYAIYGANAKAVVGAYTFGVGVQGWPENDDLGIDAEMLSNVRFMAGTMLNKMVGVDLGVLLYTGGEQTNGVGDDRETLNTLDASIYFMAGKAKYRIGYLMVPEDDVSIDPLSTDAILNSFYLVATLNF
jgi:hypothetical protein